MEAVYGAGGVFGNSYREVGQVGQVGHPSSALSHLRGLATVRLRDLLAVGYEH